MKILYVYKQIPDVYQQYLHNVLSGIKQKLHVKTLVYEDSKASDHTVKSYGLKDKFYRMLHKLSLVKTQSLDLKIMLNYDIVHLQHSYLWTKLPPLFKLDNRPKIVITLRGADTYLKPWTYITFARFYKSKSDMVDAFIVMSNHQKNYLKRWGVPHEKIYEIPVSFGDKSEAKPKSPNKKILKLVSAFRMTWEKNIEGHVQFAKQLKDLEIPFVYDIYGNGHDLDQLYYLVDRYGLKNYINIKGKVDNFELKNRLPSYDFFVQLSITESLGMSVIEAQSFGVPCVVSDSDGLAEVVIPGKTALVNHYSQIDVLIKEMLTLWNDEESYLKFSKDAIAFVNSKFTTEIEVLKLTTLYKEL